MKKNILGLISAMVLFGMVSCSEDNFENNSPVKGGDLVHFSINPTATRTVYGAETGEQAWQVKWLANDKIRIFCDEAEGITDAEYTISPTDAEHNETLDASKYGIVKDNPEGLRWNGALISNNYPKHNFYAVYPSSAVRAVDGAFARTSDVVDLKLVNNQVCTIEGTDPGANDTYIAAPDMTNAYMVAAATNVDPRDIKSEKESGKTGGVDLVFSPIMTTLDLFVTYEGSTNSSDTDEPLNVTGITVTLPGVPRVAGNCFRYKIAPNTQATGSSGNLVSNVATSTETFFAGVRYNGGNSLPLQPGQSVKFTVLLPPVEINAANQITVRLNASGSGDYTIKVGANDGAQHIVGSAKKQIILPKITVDNESVKANNWISQLDDNIYINQLSIPGTNNSAAFKSFDDYATSQSKNLKEQWDAGVRAFEFRTAVASAVGSTSGVTCYDAGVNLQTTLASALNDIYSYVKDTEEFAIVIISYQARLMPGFNPLSAVNKMWKGFWQVNQSTSWPATYHGMPSVMTSRKETQFIDFKPDLTIGEARGKMILINFDQWQDMYGAYVQDANSVNGRGSIGGLVSITQARTDYSNAGNWHKITYNGTWTTTSIDNDNITGSYTGSETGDEGIWIQNLFGDAYTSNTQKQNAIKTADEKAVELHKSTEHKWVLNYVGGSNRESTAQYISDAAANNKFYNDWLINPTRPEGPTGIVMVSHQGVAKAQDGTPVYGENLPQTIINNNFKFRMQRKGE